MPEAEAVVVAVVADALVVGPLEPPPPPPPQPVPITTIAKMTLKMAAIEPKFSGLVGLFIAVTHITQGDLAALSRSARCVRPIASPVGPPPQRLI
jgi:hypothetical protein